MLELLASYGFLSHFKGLLSKLSLLILDLSPKLSFTKSCSVSLQKIKRYRFWWNDLPKSYSLMSFSNCFLSLSSVLSIFSMSSLSFGASIVVGTVKSTGSESNKTADILEKKLWQLFCSKKYYQPFFSFFGSKWRSEWPFEVCLNYFDMFGRLFIILISSTSSFL